VAADRSSGDVHIFGNPHLTTDPLRTLQIARNITVGLKRVAPDRADQFDSGLANLADRIHRRLFGDRLIELLGAEALERLALGGNLLKFLETNEFENVKLIDQLGGWLATAESFRDRQIICYHKNWAYLEDRFHVSCAEYVEAKPGISPTPRHVAQLIRRMRSEDLNVLLAATYFDAGKVATVANRGGATLVHVPLAPGAVQGIENYFSLVDAWVEGLAQAFATN
jgi:ABC-type Zn uptake system ZnuABC Zn-binding protein ZnuA